MKIQFTEDSLTRLTWPGGQLHLNLQPLNKAACAVSGLGVGHASVWPAGKLANTIADSVGICGLELTGYPRVPRILWDNREHHFWDGFEGGFEPRNVLINEPVVELTKDGTAVEAGCYYIANAVKTTLQWRITTAPLSWDTIITIENLTGQTLRNYLHFFACYHPPSPNYFWQADGTIQPCSSAGFVGVASDEQERTLRASPYQTFGDRYRGDQPIDYARYHRPVLISGREPCYGDARHVLMVEPDQCAAIVTWVNQARDYMIRPRQPDFKPGEVFTTRIRHILTNADRPQDLEVLWDKFMNDLQPNT